MTRTSTHTGSDPILIGNRSFSIRTPRSADEAQGEQNLTRSGVIVPIDHRAEWALALGLSVRIVEVWSGDPERCACSLVVEVGRSRSMPGFRLWRVDRLGGYDDNDALEAAVVGLTGLARREPRVLRLTLGIASADARTRERLAGRVAGLGFREAPAFRGYSDTLRVDLDGDLDEVFQRARPSCRRGVRALAKHSMEVRTIDDPALSDRLQELTNETMSRTDGPEEVLPWHAVIPYVAAHPEAARLAGVFTSDEQPSRLLAFVLGLRQGDHVEYRTAASTRENVRAPLGYALAWQVIEWGKGTGARWFDFGGLPPDESDGHPLAGIRRFKESFGGASIRFREEWMMEPHPMLGSLSRMVAAVAGRIRG